MNIKIKQHEARSRQLEQLNSRGGKVIIMIQHHHFLNLILKNGLNQPVKFLQERIASYI
jgi:hypothetical protein